MITKTQAKRLAVRYGAYVRAMVEDDPIAIERAGMALIAEQERLGVTVVSPWMVDKAVEKAVMKIDLQNAGGS